MKKKIGLIDLFIDEWHANNYPAWFRADALGSEFEPGLAWEEATAGGKPLDAWCQEAGMLPARSLAQVVEESDAICVLAPSNPEVHERLAELPLRSGKPVYIDKPFAPDCATAGRMFRLAEEHGTPLMSCSALRFAKELLLIKAEEGARDISLLATRGGGSNFPEYIIHQVEMIVSLMGSGARRLRRITSGESLRVVIEYPGSRLASLHWHPELSYAIPMICGERIACSLNTLTDYFPNLISQILRFFQTGESPIPRSETLEIAALVEAAIFAASGDGGWMEIPTKSA